jgi:two-component system OmpR family sensor kinase
MRYFTNSLRWRIVVYYTTLLALAIAVVLALGHWNEIRNRSQLSAARMQTQGLGLLPFFFPPSVGQGRQHRPLRLERPELVSQLERVHAAGVFVLALDSSGERVFASADLPRGFSPPVEVADGVQVHPLEYGGCLVTELRTRPGDRLILGMPMRILRDEAGNALRVSGAVGAGVLMVLGAAGALLVFGGMKPVAKMTADARKIANGDSAARLDPALQSEELRGLSEVLNQTFERLHEALQRQIQFTADASHELRTPLAAILADCEFSLHKERSSARYLETIQVCQESAKHMTKLVDRLGLLARLDSDDNLLDLESVELADIARRALVWVDALADAHGVVLHRDLHEIRAVADPFRMGQVLLNLLRNAVVYNRRGGSVTIRNGLHEGLAWFEVEDSGEGIAPEKLGRVFERFFRADDSRSLHTGGVGLGLAICKAIAEAHGGEIRVESEWGVGTKFRVEWPLGAV